MCGIYGFVSSSGAPGTDQARAMLDRMGLSIIHRGPDDSGVWIEDARMAGLGHRRLSIIDLSREGQQPMTSSSGRYTIVFNGEIYNYRDIRQQLDASELVSGWRGHSDTEVMLAAIDAWGVNRAVDKFNGMFAFALWDRESRELVLVRDRLGEKPLYYGYVGKYFAFASELHALKQVDGWRGEIDRNMLAVYLRHNYVPAPYSIYQGINKLLPGSILKISSESHILQKILPEPVIYWSLREKIANTGEMQFSDENRVVDELDKRLQKAVALRMEADVPLGAFLSGGYDSTAVVAQMQKQSGSAIKTFSIGFEEKKYDEAVHSREVARHLGTDHTELYVTPQDALNVIPKLPAIYDEPFSDSSQIPTYLVSKMAREHVTVSLSGDGGDEIFGGYNRYFLGQSIWKRLELIPVGIRSVLGRAMGRISPRYWDQIFSMFAPVLPRALRLNNPGFRMQWLSEILISKSPEMFYQGMVSHWKQPSRVVVNSREPATVLTDPEKWIYGRVFAERMMYFDSVTYLPDDILVKLDRASMAVSLESRVPMLDHELVEFAWQVPLEYKIRDGGGKWLLKELVHRYVPVQLMERPKMGFGVPIGDWLRGPLRGWAENLLDESRLRQEGYFHSAPIRAKWTEHLSGSKDWQYYLWDVLMFQQWLEAQRL